MTRSISTALLFLALLAPARVLAGEQKVSREKTAEAKKTGSEGEETPSPKEKV